MSDYKGPLTHFLNVLRTNVVENSDDADDLASWTTALQIVAAETQRKVTTALITEMRTPRKPVPELPMKPYTVVGVYPDNEQSCCFHVRASDRAVAIATARADTSTDFTCVGVFAGFLEMVEGDES
jgi:hypothetical protein